MIVGLEGQDKLIVFRDEAIEMAENEGVDLVQVGMNNDIPVCRLMSYKKFLYEQKKREKDNKAKSVKQDVKEVRIGDATQDNDLRTKAKTASRILSEGDKVRAVIIYKGRMMSFITRGKDKLNEFEALIDTEHTVDKVPTIEGNRVYMMLSPVTKK